MQKVYFSWLMRVNVGLIMLQVSLLLIAIGHRGLEFLQASELASFWLEDVHILRQRPGKTSNIAPTTLSAKQAASHSTSINAQLYIHL
jgi:hypothetical protein